MIPLLWDIGRVLVFLLPVIFALPFLGHAQTADAPDTLLTKVKSANIFIIKAPNDSVFSALSKKSSTLFSQVSNVTITNYTSNVDYSVKGSIPAGQTDTLKSATYYEGKNYYVLGAGNYTTAVVSVGNITPKISLGSTVILTNTFSSLPVNISNQLPYYFFAHFVARKNAVAADGYIEFTTLTSPFYIRMPFTTTVSNIDWSTDKIFNATVQYSLPGNTLSSINLSLINF